MKNLHYLIGGVFLMYSFSSLAEDLLTIYQQALQADPRIHSSALELQISESREWQTIGEMLPQVTGSANWSANNQRVDGNGTSNFHGTRYTLSLSQSLFDFGKFWSWRRSQKVIGQATAEHKEILNSLMFDVVERYFSVLEAVDQLKLVHQNKEMTQKQLEQVKKRYAKQLLKVTDVYEIEARLDALVADKIEAENILAVAKENLTELTNKAPKALQVLGGQFDFKPIGGEIKDWVAVAKAQNPTIAAQLSSIDVASDDVVVQKSAHLPIIEFQLRYTLADTGFDSATRPETETQVAAININVPLFSSGVVYHRVNEAQHKLTITKHDYEIKTRAVIKETKDAFLTTNSNYRRIQAIEKSLKSAVKSREAIVKGFSYGMETIMDVLDAGQHEYRIRRDLSQAKYNYIVNKLRFFYITGMINEGNLKEVNDWLQAG